MRMGTMANLPIAIKSMNITVKTGKRTIQRGIKNSIRAAPGQIIQTMPIMCPIIGRIYPSAKFRTALKRMGNSIWMVHCYGV